MHCIALCSAKETDTKVFLLVHQNKIFRFSVSFLRLLYQEVRYIKVRVQLRTFQEKQEMGRLRRNAKKCKGGGSGGKSNDKPKPGGIVLSSSSGSAEKEKDANVNPANLKEKVSNRRMTKLETRAKLEAERQQEIAQKRKERREKWQQESKKEIEKRLQLKENRNVGPKPSWSSLEKEKVTDSKERQSLAKNSVEWRKALKKDRTTFLFNDVLKILFEKGCFNYLKGGLQEIMSCLPVCKEWKVSVEKCMATRFLPNIFYRNEFCEKICVHLPMCFRSFINFEELQEFNEWSKSVYTGTNPFVSRKLLIGTGRSGYTWQDNQDYWREMEILLRRWGKELWDVYLHLDQGICPEAYYEVLCAYLKLMPNLRCLGIYFQHIDTGRLPPPSVVKKFQKDVNGSLEERMRRNPLPELAHLTSLAFDKYVPPLIINAAVRRYDQQLNSLNFEFGAKKRMKMFNTLSNRALPPSSSGSFPKLQEMAVSYVNLEKPLDIFTIFKNLRCVGASLQRMSLVLLKESVIQLTNEELKLLRLELPRLEILNLVVSRIALKNIDFLLPCVSLKKLNLEFSEMVPEFERIKYYRTRPRCSTPLPDEIIQFNQYTKRLYESNIWRLFPELQEVSIQTVRELAREKRRGYPPILRSRTVLIEGTSVLPRDTEGDLMFYTRKGYQRSGDAPQRMRVPRCVRRVITYPRYFGREP